VSLFTVCSFQYALNPWTIVALLPADVIIRKGFILNGMSGDNHAKAGIGLAQLDASPLKGLLFCA
jgi:hypothetical protein